MLLFCRLREREEVRECINKYPHTNPPKHSPLSHTPHHSLLLSYFNVVSVLLVLRASPKARAPSAPMLFLCRLWGERRGEVRECINKYPPHPPTHSSLSHTPHHTFPLLLQLLQSAVTLEGIAHGTRSIIANVVVN